MVGTADLRSCDTGDTSHPGVAGKRITTGGSQMTIKRLIISAALSAAIASPSAATLLPSGTILIPFSVFNTATQGTLLASQAVTGQALTFAGTLDQAVYRNTFGTLDFYYQFQRSGAGTQSNDPVETITGADFSGYLVDAQVSNVDVDGGGIFNAANNPGFGATAQRNSTGSVVGVDFAPSNPVSGTELSATYIFRTNATNYTAGTFGVLDGSSLQGMGYQPTVAAVPEAQTWALFVMGFGAAGAALRGSRHRKQIA